MMVNGVSLAGRRVLIAEDNFITAAAMVRTLKARGAEIIGPAATVTDALTLIAGNESIDAAALDLNLRGTMAYPIADVLKAKNVPMVFVTGYDHRSIAPDYANVPYMQKPVTVERLMQALFGGVPAPGLGQKSSFDLMSALLPQQDIEYTRGSDAPTKIGGAKIVLRFKGGRTAAAYVDSEFALEVLEKCRGVLQAELKRAGVTVTVESSGRREEDE